MERRRKISHFWSKLRSKLFLNFNSFQEIVVYHKEVQTDIEEPEDLELETPSIAITPEEIDEAEENEEEEGEEEVPEQPKEIGSIFFSFHFFPLLSSSFFILHMKNNN